MVSKKFDIGFIIGSLPLNRPTGGDQVVFRIINSLYKKGFSICIIVSGNSIYEDLNISRKKFTSKLEIAKFRFIYYHLLKPFIKIILHILRICEIFDYASIENIPIYVLNIDKKFDIFLKNAFATWWGTAYFLVRSKLESDKLFYLIQNNEDDSSFSGALSDFARQSYDLPLQKVVINSSLYERFKDSEPIQIPIGIDLNFWGNVKNKKENIILFPLREEKYKGGDIILDALKKVKETIHNFKFIGFGNMAREKVPSFIEFKGNVSDTDLRTLYSVSKIFVLPSRVEGFSLTNLEAMANECALISTRFKGSETYLKHMENCILVNTEDPVAIANALENLIINQDLLLRIAKKGKETSMKYSEENMVSAFEKLI